MSNKYIEGLCGHGKIVLFLSRKPQFPYFFQETYIHIYLNVYMFIYIDTYTCIYSVFVCLLFTIL